MAETTGKHNAATVDTLVAIWQVLAKHSSKNCPLTAQQAGSHCQGQGHFLTLAAPDGDDILEQGPGREPGFVYVAEEFFDIAVFKGVQLLYHPLIFVKEVHFLYICSFHL